LAYIDEDGNDRKVIRKEAPFTYEKWCRTGLTKTEGKNVIAG